MTFDLRTIDDLSDALATTPFPLFIVGSAASYAYPSAGPWAREVIAKTIGEMVLRSRIGTQEVSQELERELAEPTKEILPESLYASVAESFPPGIHEVVWGTMARPVPNPPEPNSCHLLIALTAWRHGGTILTTNFDLFLERACEKLKIPVHRVTGRALSEDTSPLHADGKLTILKIHGSCDIPGSIASKAPDLARTERILSTSGLTGHETAFVIGYSARDLDVFPWLVAESGVTSFWWIDYNFEKTHRARELSPEKRKQCFAIEEEAEVVADTVLQSWALSADNRAAEIRSRRIDPPTISFRDQVPDEAVRAVKRCDPSRPGAMARALARAYADIGRHPIAMELTALALPGPPTDEVELNLLAAFIAASETRYETSRRLACGARKAAGRVPERSIRAGYKTRASLQRAYADVLFYNLSIVPPAGSEIRFGGISTLTIKVGQIWSRFRYLWTLLRATPRSLFALRAARRAPFGETSLSHRVAWDYIESFIRLQAFAGGLLRGSLSEIVLRKIDRASLNAGYLTGALNCAKYFARSQKAGTGDLRVRGRLAVLNDQVPAALELRDQATVSAEELDRLSTETIAVARRAGLPTVELQIDIARRNAGLTPILTPAEAKRLVRSIEAKHVFVIADRLVEVLSRLP